MAVELCMSASVPINFERRQEIVDEANTHYFDPAESGKLATAFSDASFFDLTDDFTARMLPELYPTKNGASEIGRRGFVEGIDLGERYEFLRSVAQHIFLTPPEVTPCASMLGVRPALLLPASQPKGHDNDKPLYATRRFNGRYRGSSITAAEAIQLLMQSERRTLSIPSHAA